MNSGAAGFDSPPHRPAVRHLLLSCNLPASKAATSNGHILWPSTPLQLPEPLYRHSFDLTHSHSLLCRCVSWRRYNIQRKPRVVALFQPTPFSSTLHTASASNAVKSYSSHQLVPSVLPPENNQQWVENCSTAIMACTTFTRDSPKLFTYQGLSRWKIWWKGQWPGSIPC